jgi:1,4-dihydroxy-2-naphthoate octaprenyltransferase
MHRGRLSTWIAASRPRTLTAAIVPVMVGLALASRERSLDWPVAFATLMAALLIQIGTNLANDYYDFVAGADTHDRLGPPRVTQAGLADPLAVRNAAFGVLGAAAILGIWLAMVGGWPIAVIGVLSLICALAYTAGPWPLAYRGLGEIFVFVFFGIVAVNGTMFLQTGSVDALALVASIPVACLVTAILVVNNLRDIPTDARSGKRTVAVRIGADATRVEYCALVVAAFVCVPAMARMAGARILFALAALPFAIREMVALHRRDGAGLNASLAGTARLHLLFGALLSIGLAA